ncbi:MAG: VaFE repeat-containing surface-anchored protein [Oribacterium sp.]|nr:VaFE repeat-containing surface-anchored protein [Oribacterium sp.]
MKNELKRNQAVSVFMAMLMILSVVFQNVSIAYAAGHVPVLYNLTQSEYNTIKSNFGGNIDKYKGKVGTVVYGLAKVTDSRTVEKDSSGKQYRITEGNMLNAGHKLAGKTFSDCTIQLTSGDFKGLTLHEYNCIDPGYDCPFIGMENGYKVRPRDNPINGALYEPFPALGHTKGWEYGYRAVLLEQSGEYYKWQITCGYAGGDSKYGADLSGKYITIQRVQENIAWGQYTYYDFNVSVEKKSSGTQYPYDGINFDIYNGSMKIGNMKVDSSTGKVSSSSYITGLASGYSTTIKNGVYYIHWRSTSSSSQKITVKENLGGNTEYELAPDKTQTITDGGTGAWSVITVTDKVVEKDYGITVVKKSSGENRDFSGINYDAYVDNKKVANITVDKDGKFSSASGLASGYSVTTRSGVKYLVWKSEADSHTVKLVEGLGSNPYYKLTPPTEKSLALVNKTANFQTFEYTNATKTPKVQVIKESANPSITNGNSCYDLAGAEFSVYLTRANANSKTNAVATLTVKKAADGTYVTDTLDVRKYIIETKRDLYVRETKAPKGYRISNEIKSVTYSDDDIRNEVTKKVNFKDEPGNDPVNIFIEKESTEGSEESPSLEGAIFEIAYYDVLAKSKADLPKKATRKWYVKTIKLNSTYVAVLGDDTSFISKKFEVDGVQYVSDERYLGTDGKPTLPLGSITVKEIKAADGYVLESGTVKEKTPGTTVFDDRAAFGTITQDLSDSGASFSFGVTNTLIVSNSPKRGDFHFTKEDLDGKKLGGVEFDLAFVDGNGSVIEHYTIKTKSDGSYSSKDDDSLWFYGVKDHTGIEKTEGAGKLVPGNYVLTEKKNKVNKEFQLIDPFDFEIEAEEDDDLGTLTNVSQPKIKTKVWNGDTASNMYFGDDAIEVVDTVDYSYLREKTFFTMKGILMEKKADGSVVPLLDDNGNIIVAHKSFKTGASKGKSVYNTSGSVKMTFTFPGKNIIKTEGKTFVVYEYLFDGVQDTDLTVNGNEVVTTGVKANDNGDIILHADKDDADQTGLIPSIGTKVGKSTYPAGKKVSITDTVRYRNVLKGYDYTLAAELKVLDDQGNVIETIIPEDGLINFTVSGTKDEVLSSGSQNVTFTFDATGYADKKIVVFERLYIGKFTDRTKLDEKKLIGVHEDSTNKNQTFGFEIPLNIEKKNKDGLLIEGAKMEVWTSDGKTCLEKWETVEGKKHETTIKPGEYILREVEAPFGYALADDMKFTVNADCEIVVDGKVCRDNLISMIDEELVMLPSTGSRGTMSLSVLGLSMMLGGALVLGRRKKTTTY